MKTKQTRPNQRLPVVSITLLLLLNIVALGGISDFVEALIILQPGEALSFDGLNDCVSVPAIDENVYTVELWFKPTANSGLIGSNRFLIQTSDSSLIVWHNVYVGPCVWSASIGTDAWRHLAVVIDYLTWTIEPYLDGVSLGAKPTTTATKPSISFINIGCYWNNRFFNGLIDEVRFYDRELTPAEVLSHYNSGLGLYGRQETGLVGLWHFDNDADDYSGEGNHGTVYEATYVTGLVPVPDVAVTHVMPTEEKILTGETVDIKVGVKNVGGGAYEDVSVAAYYDDTLIAAQPVNGLGFNQEVALTFSWNTAGVPLGHYSIKANVSVVQGERDLLDNEIVNGTVWITQHPTASFVYAPIPAIENHSTTFDASSSNPNGGTILTYLWNFADGNTTPTSNAVTSHVYASHGTYNVTLTVEDSEDLNDTTWMIVEVLRHDVAVVDVTPYRNWVYEGFSLNINVTIANQGNFTETVTVDLYYNITAGQKVGTEIASLDPDELTTLTFSWNTTDVEACHNYVMTAVASIAVESDLTDNLLESPASVKVRILGDVDGNSAVTMNDLYLTALSFGTVSGDPDWDADLDLNQDNVISVMDLFIVTKNFGRACP